MEHSKEWHRYQKLRESLWRGRDGTGSYRKVCGNCQIEYIAGHPSSRYCSVKCRNAVMIAKRKILREESRKLTCQQCGAAFVGTRHDAKYCSNKCRQAAFRATS